MPPLKRYGHSMDLYIPSRILVIYGGKDDTRMLRGNYIFLKDLCVFDLVYLTWIIVSVENNSLRIPRFSHVALNIGTKYLIFGGINTKGYNNADITYIDFFKL